MSRVAEISTFLQVVTCRMYKMLDILSRVADFTIFLALVTDSVGAYRAGPAGTGRTVVVVPRKRAV